MYILIVGPIQYLYYLYNPINTIVLAKFDFSCKALIGRFNPFGIDNYKLTSIVSLCKVSL